MKLKLLLTVLVMSLLVFSANALLETKSYSPETKTVIIRDNLITPILSVKLVDHTPECFSCHTTYEICNFKKENFDLKSFDLNFYNTKDMVTDKLTTNNKMEYKVEEKYNITQPVYEPCIKYYDQTDNKTQEITKIPYNSTCFAYDKDVEMTRVVWNPIQPKEALLAAEDCFELKISADIKPNTEVDNVISLAGFELKEFAWWNNSWDRKRNLTAVANENIALSVNGSGGWQGYSIWFNPYQCNETITLYYKSTNASDYRLVCNQTTEMNFDTGDPSGLDNNPEGVYPAATTGVWHFDGDLLDATSNRRNGTLNGAASYDSESLFAGQSVKFPTFNESADYVSFTSEVGVTGTVDRTYISIIKDISLTGGTDLEDWCAYYLMGDNTNGEGWGMWQKNSNVWFWGRGSSYDEDLLSARSTDWSLWIIDFEDATNTMHSFKNDSAMGFSNLAYNTGAGAPLRIANGLHNPGAAEWGQACDHYIDEFRISTKLWDAAERKALWDNYEGNNATLGVEESVGGGGNAAPTITVPVIYPDPANTSDDLNCSAIASDAENTSLNIDFAWWKNGAVCGGCPYNVTVATVNDTITYTSALVDEAKQIGENWTCMVRADDGEDVSGWYNYTIQISAANTCTLPTDGSNHELDMSDYCNSSSNAKIGNLTITGCGNWRIEDANISVESVIKQTSCVSNTSIKNGRLAIG